MNQRLFIFMLLIFLLLMIGIVNVNSISPNDLIYAQLQTTNGTTSRISVASDGTQANGGHSTIPSISANGRYVAFQSIANNLVPSDTNGVNDVFVHDRETGQTSRVSVASDGTQADGASPSISADGRYVAFQSSASNLVPGDTNEFADVFVHDRETGQTSRVSVASDGTQANGLNPSISADGRYVAFQSSASNLVPGDTNGFDDVFVHDRETGQTSRVSVASDGTQPNGGHSIISSISADGRYVAFQSLASNLVPGDTNGVNDIFVHDRETGQTSRVSVASDGTQTNGGSFSNASISADGRYVAFQSLASNLVPGDTNNEEDIFIHDRQTGQTSRVSIASDGTQGNSFSRVPMISADGRYVTFVSSSNNLVPDDTNSINLLDVFIHDRETGQTSRVSVTSDGTQTGGSASSTASISANGRYVAFSSFASDLVPDDTNNAGDIFVHDRGIIGFLDLPIDYSNTTFAKAVQGNTSGNSGRVNAWFDHTSPNNSENNDLTRWNGVYSGSSPVNKYTCEIKDFSCYDGHSGTDFQKLMVDEPILAAASGIVTDTVYSNSGYGNRVWINHQNGYATLYAHLKSISVGEDQSVIAGQEVGIMGNTGVSIGTAGIHLHFGVYYDQNGDGQWTENEVVDPFGWSPLPNSTQNDPWAVPSYYLWKYPLNVQATQDSGEGSISSVSGETTASIPAGALTSAVTFDLWEAPPVAGASAQLRSVGFSSWLRVLEWLTEGNSLMTTTATNEFNQPVTITINYSEADLAHLDENQLAIQWWDIVNNQWQMLPTTVNVAQKTALAETTQTGNFDLQAPLLCPADIREPDDNYYAATFSPADGTSWSQRFDISQDQDWFKFEATTGETYLVETSALAAGVDTRVEVYDQDGITLLSSDDNSGDGAASYLEWTAPGEGVYFVRIVQSNGSNFGCGAAYNFGLSASYKVFLPSIMNLP